MKNKSAFLYVYKAANLGDDLFVHAITRRYPDVQFYTWADGVKPSAFSAIGSLKELNPESALICALRAIRPSLAARYKTWLEKRCDAVVYIGGSLFIEYEKWPQILNWWEHAATQYRFFVLGANFGPYTSEAYRARLETIFARMQDVCFRDTYSRSKFSACPNVRCAPDILFGYPMPKVETCRKQVLFSVIHCGRKDEGRNALAAYHQSYVAAMAQLLRGYWQDGFECVLSSFCRAEGDEEAIGEILLAAGFAASDERIRVLCYHGANAEEILSAIAQSQEVIATRFHAAILALAAGRPVFPVVYSDKTIRVLEDIRFEGGYADLRDGKQISYEQARANCKTVDLQILDTLKRKAQQHFERLDALLIQE